ncbi:DUF2442 domain-containing protein [Vibrio methylphosphonaticus]|uniref:DUF2442 domain-containing protein n=1 Tax=Vibrio methylphosphonaticus TaxID=2946866 RepID=UPI002029CF05|nr:DUF2442 domain-containing protein [Vibrio methylphosphonaticus]MCL9775478.1 DUF2442 domain-containing protein [Vibrio methylphosphonaticus]
MNPSVVSVQPTDDYKLIISFDNSDMKLFDVSPYLDKGIFQELKDVSYFKRVSVAFGSVEWPNEQDFSYDTLYLLGQNLTEIPQPQEADR